MAKLSRAPLFDIGHIPEGPGVYLLYWGDECVYVGRSINMRRRVRLHNLRGKFDRVEAIPLPRVSLQAMEHSLIYKHKPKYNTNFCNQGAFPNCGVWYWESGRWLPANYSSIEWMRRDGRCIATRKAV